MVFYIVYVWIWWYGGICMIFFEGRIVFCENWFCSVVRFSWFWEIREIERVIKELLINISLFID